MRISEIKVPSRRWAAKSAIVAALACLIVIPVAAAFCVYLLANFVAVLVQAAARVVIGPGSVYLVEIEALDDLGGRR